MSPAAKLVNSGSATVTSTIQFAELPASSVAVMVTIFTPTPMVAPTAGDCVMVIFPCAETLSVAELPETKSGVVVVPLIPA